MALKNPTAGAALALLDAGSSSLQKMALPRASSAWATRPVPVPEKLPPLSAAEQEDLDMADGPLDEALWKSEVIACLGEGRRPTDLELAEVHAHNRQERFKKVARAATERVGPKLIRYQLADLEFELNGEGPTMTIDSRLEARHPLTVTELQQCWILAKGGTNQSGYAQCPNNRLNKVLPKRTEKKGMTINRMAALLNVEHRYYATLWLPNFHGSHLCDNRACFNPRHVTWETNKDNQARKNCRGIIAAPDGTHIRACWHWPMCLRVTPAEVLVPGPAAQRRTPGVPVVRVRTDAEKKAERQLRLLTRKIEATQERLRSLESSEQEALAKKRRKKRKASRGGQPPRAKTKTVGTGGRRRLSQRRRRKINAAAAAE